MSRVPPDSFRTAESDAFPGIVLDSYAILALLDGEQVAEEVAGLLTSDIEHLLMTYVNLGEVIYTIMRERGRDQADTVLLALESSRLTLVPAERMLTLAAAHLKARYRISYADAFCAALGQITGFPVATGDPEFRDLQEVVRVRWLAGAPASGPRDRSGMDPRSTSP